MTCKTINACQKCGSKRVFNMSALVSKFDVSFLGESFTGKVLQNAGISDHRDYIRFMYCGDCGQIQGTWPVKNPIY